MTKPKAPAPSPTGKKGKAHRAELQRRRRAREHVLEVETFEEAQRELARAFGRLDSEAASPASPATPTPPDVSTEPAPSETAPAAPAASGGVGPVLTQEASPPTALAVVKPPEQASPPPGDAKPDAEAPNPEGEPAPSFKLDLDELGDLAAMMTDEAAQKYIRAKALSDEKRAKLAKAFAPALREWLPNKGPDVAVTPTEALLITVGLMYGKELMAWLIDEPAPEPARDQVINMQRARPANG